MRFRKWVLVGALAPLLIGCSPRLETKQEHVARVEETHEVRVGRTADELKAAREEAEALRKEAEARRREEARAEQRQTEERRAEERRHAEEKRIEEDRRRSEEAQRRAEAERAREDEARQRAEAARLREELERVTPLSYLTRAEKKRIPARELVDRAHEEQRIGRPGVLLRYAKKLIECGRPWEAEARLKEIAEVYPGSKEAKEAKAIQTEPLKKMSKSGLGGMLRLEQFVGRWRIVNDEGITAAYFTLTNTLEARKDHAPNAPGKWQVVGDEVRITWSDGWRDLFRPQKDDILVISYGPGAEWDKLPAKPVRTQRAVKMEK